MQNHWTRAQRADLNSIVGLLAKAGGSVGDLDRIARHPGLSSAVRDLVLRAAVSAGVVNSSDAGAAEALAPLIGAIEQASALGALIDRGVSLPTLTMPALIGTISGAGGVTEGSAKPINAIAFDLTAPVRTKAHVVVVVSAEAANTGRIGEWIIAEAERRLVPALNDELADVLGQFALQSVTASGTAASDILHDTRVAADLLGSGSSSLLLLLVSPDAARLLDFANAAGLQAFPERNVAGVPYFECGALGGNSPGDALLIDCSRVAIGDAATQISVARHATVAMSDAPGGDDAIYSLFQRNAVGIRVEQFFSIAASSDTSQSPVVSISGAWG